MKTTIMVKNKRCVLTEVRLDNGEIRYELEVARERRPDISITVADLTLNDLEYINHSLRNFFKSEEEEERKVLDKI